MILVAAGHNVLIYGVGQIKNEATFFIVFIIILFTVLVHRVGRDEAALPHLTLRALCWQHRTHVSSTAIP
jgi:hypothetical protein